MTKRVIFAIQKGGVGKTTSTVTVAEILAAAGYRVLVVDFDSQGNATRMLTKSSIYRYSGKTIMEGVMQGNVRPYIVPINDNLDLIPAEDRASMFSRYIYTSGIEKPYAVLTRILENIENDYDYVFIDVGPSLGDHMINALVYTDHIIVPVDGGDLALDALIRFDDFVSATRNEGHTNARISGIVITMKDRRSNYEKDVAEGIRQAYGDLVFETEIGRKVRLKEMSARGVDLDDNSLKEYIALTEEIIKRTK